MKYSSTLSAIVLNSQQWNTSKTVVWTCVLSPGHLDVLLLDGPFFPTSTMFQQKQLLLCLLTITVTAVVQQTVLLFYLKLLMSVILADEMVCCPYSSIEDYVCYSLLLTLCIKSILSVVYMLYIITNFEGLRKRNIVG